VALAALICAYHESDESALGLRATLPFAGRSLVERQARLALAAGAERIVILVEMLPPALAAAIDRLRTEGVGAIVARSVAEAAEAVQPGDQLLLIADGLLADESDLARLVRLGAPVLLTVPDAGDERFERIDAHSRWAGLALLDGGLFRDTAAMLDEWDLQSTLLRRAVQGGARQVALPSAATPPVLAREPADLLDAEARMIAGAGGGSPGWASRYLLAPIERALTNALMPTAIGPEWLNIAAATLTGLGGLFFIQGWLWPGALALLAATPLDGVADRLARLRLQPGPRRAWTDLLLPGLGAAALLALGWALATPHGWGTIVLSATAIAFMLALQGELRGEAPEEPEIRFLAERKGMTWAMLPFALAGWWTEGLAGLACWAAGSFFWAQRRAHRPAEPAAQD
jgi:hypothetical protein